MHRIHLARLALLSGVLFMSGCNWCRTCSDRPGLFSRFRMASNTQPVVMPSGECCDPGMGGPMLPSPGPGNVLPPPDKNIPRIDENGKQLPWDPKMSRPAPKTGNEVKNSKEGT